MLKIRTTNTSIALFVAIGCILPLTWLGIIVAHASEYLPYGDQWDTPLRHLIHWKDGSFQWSELLSQHNESRKLVTSILSLLMFNILGHWSIKAELIGTFLLSFAKVLAITLLFYKSKVIQSLERYRIHTISVLFIVLLALNYGRSTYIFQLWSVTAERTITDIFFVSMLYTLLGNPGEKWRILILVLAPLLAAYSYSSGLLLIPISVFIAVLLYLRKIIKAKTLTIVCVSNIAILFAYFIDYKSSPGHSALGEVLRQPINKIIEFIVAFIGNTSPILREISYQQALIQGSIILFSLLIGVVLLKKYQPERTYLMPSELDTFGCLILLYVGGLAVMSCIARLPMDIMNSIRNDYVIHPTFGIVGVLAIFTQILLTIKPQPTRNLLNLLLALSCTLNACVAVLVYDDIANQRIDFFEKISMFEDCLVHKENVQSSRCYEQNSMTHPYFSQYFEIATRLNILTSE